MLFILTSVNSASLSIRKKNDVVHINLINSASFFVEIVIFNHILSFKNF